MNNNSDIIQQLVMDIFHHMGVICSVEVAIFDRVNNSQGYNINVNSDTNLSYVYGRNGSNIGSIEHLIRVALSRKDEFKLQIPFISLDINGIRKEKHEQIKNMAISVASRVKLNGRPEIMAPMDAFERRIVHNELATLTDIETESIGIDPNRRIVVKPILA